MVHQILNVLFVIVVIAFGLGLLVFIHELGHFLTAKFFKVKVLTFAFGFGPDLISFKRKGEGTKYAIKAIPLGGFVSMAGDNADTATGGEGEYFSLSWYKKALIAFAGPFYNYILAIILFSAIIFFSGIPQPLDTYKITDIMADSPAQTAGILKGDKIISIGSVKIKSWEDITDNIRANAGKKTAFIVERGTYSFSVNIQIGDNGMIGIAAEPDYVYLKSGFFASIAAGVKAPINYTKFTLVHLWKSAKNKTNPQLSGPIGVMKFMADSAKSGFGDYIQLLAILSVALGLFNLLPIPLVDGGMIVLFIVEGIIRKKISNKVISIYNTIGLVIILFIFIYATQGDLARNGVFQWVGKLFGGS